MSLNAYVVGDGVRCNLSTSASGTMAPSPAIDRISLCGSFCFEGPVSWHMPADDWERVLFPLPQTGVGGIEPEEAEEASAIMELRRLSGLTWERLAALLGVARRTLHFWASGKPMNAANEGRMRRVLALLRVADRGSAKENRAMLLGGRGNISPFDLLARGAYDLFIRLVGQGPGRETTKLKGLAPEARQARKPLPPGLSVGALQDRVLRIPGKARPGRSAKPKQHPE